jgi:hypothetical protein
MGKAHLQQNKHRRSGPRYSLRFMIVVMACR